MPSRGAECGPNGHKNVAVSGALDTYCRDEIRSSHLTPPFPRAGRRVGWLHNPCHLRALQRQPRGLNPTSLLSTYHLAGLNEGKVAVHPIPSRVSRATSVAPNHFWRLNHPGGPSVCKIATYAVAAWGSPRPNTGTKLKMVP